jgi:hypothetical protein
MRYILLFISTIFFLIDCIGQSKNAVKYEILQDEQNKKTDYYDSTFKLLPLEKGPIGWSQQSLETLQLQVFFNSNKPPNTYTDLNLSGRLYKQTADTTKRIYVAFFYTRMNDYIGVLYVEDSKDVFKPISIDTFYHVKDKFNSNNNTPMYLSYALNNNEFVIEIVYGNIALDSIFDRRPLKKNIYKWPDNFDQIRKLQALRTE